MNVITARCVCGSVLEQPVDGTTAIVTCECGQGWAIVVRFGRPILATYDGDAKATGRCLTLRYGALLAGQRYPDEPERAVAYFEAWRHHLKARDERSYPHWVDRVIGTGARVLWRAYGHGHRWLKPLVYAYSAVIDRMYGGMSPRNRAFVEHAFAPKETR